MRPDLSTYLLAVARTVALRSTCPRRQVGCVLATARGEILATGYNGVPRGVDHCRDGRPCPGVDEPSGTTVACRAIHAEMNAVAHCRAPAEVAIVACTAEPCPHCLKLLLATNAELLIVGERYHGSGSLELWAEHGRDWRYLP